MRNVEWNQNDKDFRIEVDASGLRTSSARVGLSGIRAMFPVSEGKWYWEVKQLSGGNYQYVGITTKDSPLDHGSSRASMKSEILIRGSGDNSLVRSKGADISAYGEPWGNSDTIGVLLDLEKNTISFRVNGRIQSGGEIDLVFDTHFYAPVYPVVFHYSSSSIMVANFGSSDFEHEIPQGFSPYSSSMTPPRKLFVSSSQGDLFSLESEKWTGSLVPQMVSDSHQRALVTASSTQGSFSPYRAFDRVLGSRWTATEGKVKGEWIQVDFLEPKRVDKVIITAEDVAASSIYTPLGFSLSASNDGLSWDLLSNVSCSTRWARKETREFPNSVKSGFYRYYRVTVTEGSSLRYVSFSDILMVQCHGPKMTHLLPEEGIDAFEYGTSPEREPINLKAPVHYLCRPIRSHLPLGSGRYYSTNLPTPLESLKVSGGPNMDVWGYTKALSGGKVTYPERTSGEVTVEFYIKILSRLGANCLIFPGSSRETSIALSTENKIGIQFASNCYGGYNSPFYGGRELDLGVLYHVAVVYASTYTRLYIDGEIDYERGASVTCSRVHNSVSVPSDGSILIEGVKFWNRPLTNEEVLLSSQMKGAPLSDTSGLIVFDLFDPDSGAKNEVTGVTAQTELPIYYEDSIINKRLAIIEDEGAYKAFRDGQWETVSTEALSEDLFLQHGMDSFELRRVPRNAYSELSSPLVLYYVDDFFPSPVSFLFGITPLSVPEFFNNRVKVVSLVKKHADNK